MPDRRDPPPTDEGWYALHDFRTIDWDAWREASGRQQGRALDEAVAHLASLVAVEDADEGATAVYSVLGHDADLLLMHLRPTTAHLDAIERGFERTEFAGFTDQVDSYVSVTEASGYSERARSYFEGELDPESGLAKYIRSRLYPTVPDATHVCFYPMDKRRDPEQNWYDLSFEERAEHMEAHGDIGRNYGGKVTQMITGSIGLDDWEWGVTLWADDLTDVKDLLYEMRFDPSTSQFAEFGPFTIGRRFPPADLPALLAGEAVPSDEGHTADVGTSEQPQEGPTADDAHETASGAQASPRNEVEAGTDGGAMTAETADSPASSDGETHDEASAAEGTAEDGTADEGASGPPAGVGGGGGPDDVDTAEVEGLESKLAALGFEQGTDYDPGDHAVIVYSSADADGLAEDVSELRGHFEAYDTHVGTTVRGEGGRSAVVSIWTRERAVETAAGFLEDLPEVVESIRGPLAEGAAAVSTDVGETGDEGDSAAEGDDGADGAGTRGGGPPAGAGAGGDADSIREELAEMDVYAGQPHGEDVYALVAYSQADIEELVPKVKGLGDGFDRYDTHEGTSVYAETGPGETAAVVSLWTSESGVEKAADFVSSLPGIVGWADAGDGFGTMGMFYQVKPEYREEFVETFGEVGELLGDMDGHRESSLLANVDDENDMFIASQWDSKDDAMAFFRSDAFKETVDWGRDVLADRPRHVFLA